MRHLAQAGLRSQPNTDNSTGFHARQNSQENRFNQRGTPRGGAQRNDQEQDFQNAQFGQSGHGFAQGQRNDDHGEGDGWANRPTACGTGFSFIGSSNIQDIGTSLFETAQLDESWNSISDQSS